MALLKFYRGSAAPALETGKIWFDSANQVIKVCTTTTPAEGSDGWEPYGLSEAEIAALILAAKNEVLGTLEADDAATLKALNEEIDALQAELAALAAKTVTINEKAAGHVTVSKTVDAQGATVYTVAENDIASAQALTDEIKRAGDEEARIEGLVTAEAGRAAGEEARIEGLVNTEKGRAEGVEAGLQAAIDTLNGADTVSGSVAKAVKDAKDSLLGGAQTLTDFAKVETAIAEAEAAAKAAASVVVEGTDAGNNLTIVPTTGENGATTYTVNLTDVASAATLEAVKADVDYFFSDALNKENADALKDTLKEIQTYIDSDVEGAAAMAQSIKANSDAIDAIEADYLTSSDKTELTGAIATAKGEAIDAAAGNTTAAIQALDAEVTSTDGSKVTVKVTEVDGVITAVNVTENDIASAQALATLDAEVQEHEQVVSAALNDLNARMTTAEGSVADHETRLAQAEADIDALEAWKEGLNTGVMSVTGDESNAYVKVVADPTTGDVALGVTVASVDAANGGAAGLATDAYVREQISAAALVWEEGSF